MAGAAEMAEDRRVLKPRFETSVLEDREEFRDALARWFAKNGRDYPWRRTREPYAILVSEVMLQQTQIATVLGKGYFTRFLATFPDLRALAAADDAALAESVGRARLLPAGEDAAGDGAGGASGSWRGVSAGSAGVAETAGGGAATRRGPCGRLRSMLRRCWWMATWRGCCRGCWIFPSRWMTRPGSSGSGSWAGELADPQRPRIYHAALMELGQAVCRPGVPDCLHCPVARFCRTARPGTPAGEEAGKSPITRGGRTRAVAARWPGPPAAPP